MDAEQRTNALILSMANRIYICSRLLSAAAERMKWDSDVVQELIEELRESVSGSINERAGSDSLKNTLPAWEELI